MKNECELNLKKYNVDKISFDLNPKFDFSVKGPIDVSPDIGKKINKIDENNCKVCVGFIVKKKKDENIPFEMEIWVSGEFEVEKWETTNKNYVEKHAIAILFPFLRALVATITSNANVPPYILPVFNIVSWLEEEKKRLKAEKTKKE